MHFNTLIKYSLLYCCVWLLANVKTFAQADVSSIVNEIMEEKQTTSDNILSAEELFNDLIQIANHPILLNTATKEQLEQLMFLSDYQIENLLYYLYTSGAMKTLYELKAVEGMDAKTIRWLLPFVTLEDPKLNANKRAYFSNSLITRATRIQEVQKGFQIDSGNRFLGSRNAVLLKYDGDISKKITWHLLSEKDKGETSYLDFLSGGLQYTGNNLVRKIVIGDYKIRAGQGLISWSGSSMGKTMDVDQVRKKGDVISLYKSSTESGFYRGGAINLGYSGLNLNLWGSATKLDASTDSIDEEEIIRSISEDGLHNTPNKLANKHVAEIKAFGANLLWNNKWLRSGFTYLYQPLDIPILKISDESFVQIPKMDSWHNYSFDFFKSFKAMHFWGEFAMQSHGSQAYIIGSNFFPHDALQGTIIYRNYSPDFYSVYGSSFGESGNPTNEKGLFLGIKLSPAQKLVFNASLDIYSFPWLRYQQSFTTSGFESYLKATFTPDRQHTAHVQVRYEEREKTVHSNTNPMDDICNEKRLNVRFNYDSRLENGIGLTSRIEFTNYTLDHFASGVLLFQDLRYQPPNFPLSGSMRFAWCNVSSFDARLYAYENDVLYAFSVPAYYGNGIRTYLNLKYQPLDAVTLWLRYARTTFLDREELGSGLDLNETNHSSEIKIQLRVSF